MLSMKAMLLDACGELSRHSQPLRLADVPMPGIGPDQVLLRVIACGVCHTELDEIEGRTAPPQLPVIPGHEVVGTVEQVGAKVARLKIGDRVGVGWIHCSCGGSRENVDPAFTATGRDVNGGYAEYMVAHGDYAFRIPEVFADDQAPPLLCAGAVGYRSLKLTGISNGQVLGLTGFGGSAHLVLQVARHLYPDSPLLVFARDASAREFALQLGADWAGDTIDTPPELAHAIIDTTPAWLPVVEAMSRLKPGGRLVINAIRKEEGDRHSLDRLSYHDHLWMEKEIKSVANVTGDDIAEFLDIAGRIPVATEVTHYALEDANRALVDLKFEPVRGAKVLDCR